MKQNKSINEPGTVLESQVSGVPIVSNHMGPNGESIDRIYGGGAIPIRLVNKDYTTYKGNISKVSIMKKSLVDNTRFRSYCYKTDDGRWFDRAGLPISKPNKIESDDETDTLQSEDTQQD
jgi:hypothetical protein